jgi:glutaredoxin
MYMTSWCPVCARAREWMTSQGYDFVEYDVETDVRAGRVMRAINPRGTVPMFEIDRMILIGFSPEMLRRAIARADARRREDAPAPP